MDKEHGEAAAAAIKFSFVIAVSAVGLASLGMYIGCPGVWIPVARGAVVWAFCLILLDGLSWLTASP